MNRKCFSYNGKAKHAYATIDEALDECARHGGMTPYRCPEHGWHVGHQLSRSLREGINQAKAGKRR